jgi:Predicted flavoprotein
MRFLVVLGTAREKRSSVGPAKAVIDEFENKGENVDLFDLKEKNIPPLGNRTYKEDEEPVPEDIQEFSEKVENCDGLVLVAPEYNHSVPGTLKNALDYLYPEYSGKPFMYVPVSAGSFGGVRSLNHLHDITLGLGALPGPDLPISKVHESFSKEGEILDEAFESRVKDFVEKSIKFTENIAD